MAVELKLEITSSTPANTPRWVDGATKIPIEITGSVHLSGVNFITQSIQVTVNIGGTVGAVTVVDGKWRFKAKPTQAHDLSVSIAADATASYEYYDLRNPAEPKRRKGTATARRAATTVGIPNNRIDTDKPDITIATTDPLHTHEYAGPGETVPVEVAGTAFDSTRFFLRT